MKISKICPPKAKLKNNEDYVIEIGNLKESDILNNKNILVIKRPKSKLKEYFTNIEF